MKISLHSSRSCRTEPFVPLVRHRPYFSLCTIEVVSGARCNLGGTTVDNYQRLKLSVYDSLRPKASVSLIVGCSTETTSGSTRPPIIETEVWGPLSVRHCTEQMVRFDRTAMNEICNEIFTLYILITAAIITQIKNNIYIAYLTYDSLLI